MARLAIIAYQGNSGPREVRLGGILDFFGVPWQMVETSHLGELTTDSLEYALFGTIRTVAFILRQSQRAMLVAGRPIAVYAYAEDDPRLCEEALKWLFEDANVSLQAPPAEKLTIGVSYEYANLTGPMTGINFTSQLASEDSVLMGVLAGEASMFATLVSAGNAQMFVRYQHKFAPVFLCTSSRIVDIDEPVRQGFYDIKDHFCSVVPLVMFIKHVFPDLAWGPAELGACLVIDDPLLKPTYGFCNFSKLRDLMQEHQFTTNIAFIPWNWRRTSPATGNFFNQESKHFSISVHGCDHTAGEFGTTSIEALHNKAQLARSRMRDHEARTKIHHDPIMIFPQGVFSSDCPQVLKRNGFLAAVNTEIAPVDSQNAQTRIRDVWDVAIMKYGGFPIFTRRYAFHGLENFAFDLLLGKPCIIVAHHDSFKDEGAALVDLIGEIGALNCSVHWRSLGQVVRRACRRRNNTDGSQHLEMYANELIVENPSNQAIELRIWKRKSSDDVASQILCDGMPVTWRTKDEHFVFGGRIEPHSESNFRVVYPEQAVSKNVRRSLRFEAGVAARRLLSEFRDNYVATNWFLSASANKLKSMIRKAN